MNNEDHDNDEMSKFYINYNSDILTTDCLSELVENPRKGEILSPFIAKLINHKWA